MIRAASYFLALAMFLTAGPAFAQAGGDKETAKAAPIVKNEAVALPAGARLQLGKLAGFRYDGRAATGTLSPDGKLLAVADLRDGVTILDIAAGKTVQTLKVNLFSANSCSIAFSADNSTVAVQTFSELMVWEVASGKQLRKVQHRDGPGMRINGPSLSKDGKIIAIATDRFAGKGQTGQVSALDLAADKTIGPFDSIHNYNMRTAIAPDGKTMLSWGMNLGAGVADPDRKIPNTIQIWDLVKGKELSKVLLPSSVVAAGFAPDGKAIAALGSGGIVHLLEVETGKESRRFTAERTQGYALLRYSPDGRQIVVADANGGVQFWDAAEGTRIKLVNAPKAPALGIAFPGKDRLLVLGMLGSTLNWWDATDPKASPFEGNVSPIAALAFTADGKSVISAGADQRLIWWDATAGKVQRQLTLEAEDKRLTGGVNRPISFSLSPDGKHAVTYSYLSNRGVQLWDLKDGRSIRELKISRNFSPIALEFSGDGSKVSAAGLQTPVNVWDANTGQGVYATPAGNGGTLDTRCAISPNGNILALQQFDRFGRQLASDIGLWDLVEKKELRRIDVPGINLSANNTPNLGFSADGKFLAIADTQGTILLYSTATGREWRTLKLASRTSMPQFAFSADGRFIAAGNSSRNVTVQATAVDDVIVEIWEIASGLKRDVFKGNAAGVTCLAFSPDGATLATGSQDTTLLLWDLAGKSAKMMPLAESELPAAWKSLAGDDAKMSETIRRLVHTPATLAYFKEHFQPSKADGISEADMEKLVADLDNTNFKKREVAYKALKKLAESAEPALKKGLAGKATVEARRRMQNLLEAMVRQQLTPAELQAMRGVEVLERIGTPEAREWLTALAKGDPTAYATQQAAAALKRAVRK